MIVRFNYLNKIKKFINVPLVKVLYGVRSCGKSIISSMLENIVYLELKRRKYDVYIGKYLNKEIDFIGIRRDEKIYVQVCNIIPESSNCELNNLMEIKDHYHKYLVTNDVLSKSNENGIEIMYIGDFLLKDYNNYEAQVTIYENKFLKFIDSLEEQPDDEIDLIKMVISKVLISKLKGQKEIDMTIIYKFEEI